MFPGFNMFTAQMHSQQLQKYKSLLRSSHQNPSMEGGYGHEVPPITEEVLVDGYWCKPSNFLQGYVT